MTSDFDKDEIQDSAFPIDFSQDSASLDMYGVWVKSGPRDVSVVARDVESIVSDPEIGIIDDLSQFSELPDFPDFNSLEQDISVSDDEQFANEADSGSIQAEIQDEPFDFDESDIQFEEIVPPPPAVSEASFEPVSSIETAFAIPEPDEIVSIDPSSYDDVDFNDFDSADDVDFEKTVLDDNKADEPFVFETIDEFPEIEFEDIKTEDLGQDDDSPNGDSYEDIPISQEIPIIDDSFDEQIIEDEPFDVAVEIDEPVIEPVYDDVIEPLNADQVGTIEDAFDEPVVPDQVETIEDALDEPVVPDQVETIEDALDEPVVPDQVETIEDALDDHAQLDAELPSDMDFSDFLDDLNSGSIEPPPESKPSPSNDLEIDDLDLDSFIDSFNESGGVGADETEKLFTDSEPVEIDLEFDESYIEDANRIKASGSSVSNQEYDSLEFGVEMIDESAGAGGDSSAFDSFFDSIPDMGETAGADSASHDDSSPSLESTTEFDDLLVDLENAAVQALRSDSPSFSGKTAQSYNLSVTLDEDLNASAPAVADSQSDEDIQVSLVSSTGSGKSESPVARSDNAASAFAPAQSSDSSDEIDALLAESGLMETVGSRSVFSEPENSFDEVPVFSDDEVESMQSDEPAEQALVEPFGSFDDSFSANVIDEGEYKELPALNENQEFIDIPDNSGYNEDISYPQADNSVTLEDSVSVDFDDISAVEQELSEMAPETEEKTVIGTDRSTELLMKIADELSSIKNEISTLKNELAGIKGLSAESPESSFPGTQDKTGETSGFFTDDDPDETIALTGDELNNILITADFTEEKNDGIDSSASEELQLENIEITDFSDSTPGQADDVESAQDNRLEIETESYEEEIPETLPDSIFESSDFEIPEPVEVGHVNALMDDTSYLEGEGTVEPDLDNVAIEEPDLEIIDFDDEKLEEPELTEFNIDLSDIETSFDTDLPKEQELAITDIEDSDLVADSENQIVDFSDDIGDISIEEPALGQADETSIEDFSINEEDIHLSDSDSFETAVEESVEMPVYEDIVVEKDSAAEEDISPPTEVNSLPVELKEEIKSVLSYMDQLLESLPEEKIEEFARSEHFEVYKKLFEELGIS